MPPAPFSTLSTVIVKLTAVGGRKVAVTCRGPFIVTVQSPVPVQRPDQPTKTYGGPVKEKSCTSVPGGIMYVHVTGGSAAFLPQNSPVESCTPPSASTPSTVISRRCGSVSGPRTSIGIVCRPQSPISSHATTRSRPFSRIVG